MPFVSNGPIREELIDFEGAVAASGKSVLRIPTGPTYRSLLLRFLASSVALDRDAIANDISRIRLTIGTDTFLDLTGAEFIYAWCEHRNIEVSGGGEELVASEVNDPGSLADGAGETLSITVTGAALGDTVRVAAPYDLQDLSVTAYVSAANTVEVRIQNESGSTIDLASGTWYVYVTPRSDANGDGVLPIIFNRKKLENFLEQEGTALGTQYEKSLTLRIDWASSVTCDEVQAYADTTSPTPMGTYIASLKHQAALSSSGVDRVQDLEVSPDEGLAAMHIAASTVTRVKIMIDDTTILDWPKALLDRELRNIGYRVRPGYTTVRFDQRDQYADILEGNFNRMKMEITHSSAPNDYEIIADRVRRRPLPAGVKQAA